MGIKNYILAAAILLWTTGETNATNHSPPHVTAIQEMSKQEVRDTLIPPADWYTTPLQRLQKHHPDSLQEAIIYFILTETNTIREENCAGSLAFDHSLTVAAQKHAEYLSTWKRFSHTWRKWSLPPQRAKKAWYTWNGQIGENIWAWYWSIESAMQAWKRSPRHFATMTSNTFTKVWIWQKWNKRVVLFGE